MAVVKYYIEQAGCDFPEEYDEVFCEEFKTDWDVNDVTVQGYIAEEAVEDWDECHKLGNGDSVGVRLWDDDGILIGDYIVTAEYDISYNAGAMNPTSTVSEE